MNVQIEATECRAILSEPCLCSVFHGVGAICLHTLGWHSDGCADHEYQSK